MGAVDEEEDTGDEAGCVLGGPNAAADEAEEDDCLALDREGTAVGAAVAECAPSPLPPALVLSNDAPATRNWEGVPAA